MAAHSKVLITGVAGFTGRYLQEHLMAHGYNCVALQSNLLNKKSVASEVAKINPDYVIHLAAISFAAELNIGKIYEVNVVGSLNLLDALASMKAPPKNVILASSAAVYGKSSVTSLTENLVPRPVNHYGCSKLCMENMAQNYIDSFPVTIARPFNYTGIGHAEHFLIPKIVKAFQHSEPEIALGNLEVYREFNDIRDVCITYRLLIESSIKGGVVNICTGHSISLLEIIELMSSISGIQMKVKIDPFFVRENEIKDLSGNPAKLRSYVNVTPRYTIEDTLRWMYASSI